MSSIADFPKSRKRVGRISLVPFAILVAALCTITHTIPDTRLNCFASQDQHGRNQPVTAVPTLANGDLYALVVGISRYKNPSVPALQGAANDARAFAGFLETQRDLFRALNIKLLTDEQATKDELEKYLAHEARNAGQNETMILFFSGHGAVDPNQPGRFYFLTHDADPAAMETTALDMSGLAFLKDLACSRVVLIADACHSGGFSERKAKAGANPLKTFAKNFGSSAGRVVITSSRPDEHSLESRYRDNGVFTYWFIEGLRGAADKSGSGVVTIGEAYNYAYEQTKKETNEAQHPQFQGATESMFPLSITADVQHGIPTVLDLSADPSGSEVIVGGILKGWTSRSGTLCLKYLPVGRPIPVVLRKEGWVKHDVTPAVEFSQENAQVVVPPINLSPARAILEMTTVPGDVMVKIDGQPAGKTDAKGKLTVKDVQVCVNHSIELEKEGYEREAINLAIPITYEGKKADLERVQLSRVPTARPIERIQKDYVAEKKQAQPEWVRQRLSNATRREETILRAFDPEMTNWQLEHLKWRAGRHMKDGGFGAFRMEIQDRLQQQRFLEEGHSDSEGKDESIPSPM